MTERPVALVRSSDRDDVRPLLPPAEASEGTRGRILGAGLQHFGARGFHATSIRDIASAAGLTSASLYTHFTSKEAILAELVLLGHEVHHRALVSALVEAGGDPRDQLRALVEAHVTAHCRYPELAVVTTQEQVHLGPEAAAPVQAVRSASWDLAAQVLRRGAERGVFHLLDPELTQVAVSSLGVAAGAWYPRVAAGRTPEEVGALYARLVLRMVGAEPPAEG